MNEMFHRNTRRDPSFARSEVTAPTDRRNRQRGRRRCATVARTRQRKLDSAMRGVTDARFRCSGEGRRRSATMHIRRTTTAPLSDAAQRTRPQETPRMLEPLQSPVGAMPLVGRTYDVRRPARTSHHRRQDRRRRGNPPPREHIETRLPSLQSAVYHSIGETVQMISIPRQVSQEHPAKRPYYWRGPLVICIIAGPVPCGVSSNDVAGGAMIQPRTAGPLSRNHLPYWGTSDPLGLVFLA